MKKRELRLRWVAGRSLQVAHEHEAECCMFTQPIKDESGRQVEVPEAWLCLCTRVVASWTLNVPNDGTVFVWLWLALCG